MLPTGCSANGRHAFSLDGKAWRYANEDAWTRNVTFTDGTVLRANTRARRADRTPVGGAPESVDAVHASAVGPRDGVDLVLGDPLELLHDLLPECVSRDALPGKTATFTRRTADVTVRGHSGTCHHHFPPPCESG